MGATTCMTVDNDPECLNKVTKIRTVPLRCLLHQIENYTQSIHFRFCYLTAGFAPHKRLYCGVLWCSKIQKLSTSEEGSKMLQTSNGHFSATPTPLHQTRRAAVRHGPPDAKETGRSCRHPRFFLHDGGAEGRRGDQRKASGNNGLLRGLGKIKTWTLTGISNRKRCGQSRHRLLTCVRPLSPRPSEVDQPAITRGSRLTGGVVATRFAFCK